MKRWLKRREPSEVDVPSGDADSSRELVLIPPGRRGRGGLKARLEVDEVSSAGGPIVSCSYLSDGLAAFGQKEIVFTVRGEVGDELPDLRPATEWFQMVYRFAERGSVVDVGGFSQFGVGPWGPFAGIVYTEPEERLGLEAPAELLRGVLLTPEEIEVAKVFGFSRVLVRLGRAARYYPFPPWIDGTRAGVADTDDMEATVLAKMALSQSKQMSVVLQDDRDIVVRLTPWAGRALLDVFASLPAEGAAIAFLTPIDPTANGCLVWAPGQAQREAITPEGSDGSRLSGCFVLFLPDQPTNDGRHVEDGLAFELTATSWAALRTALGEAGPLTIPADGEGFGLALEWVSDAAAAP